MRETHQRSTFVSMSQGRGISALLVGQRREIRESYQFVCFGSRINHYHTRIQRVKTFIILLVIVLAVLTVSTYMCIFNSYI